MIDGPRKRSNASADNGAFVLAMDPVARELLGEPSETHRGKRELRWGTRGSLSVNLDTGTWHDHETGQGGGVLALVQDRASLDKADAIAWLKTRGHLPQENGADHARTAKPKPRKIVASYDYTDASAGVLFQAVRYDPKAFSQRRPNGKGEWIWDLDGVPLVLYRLPELIAAVAAGATIYVSEGEQDVHTLATLGLAATCNPMGAGKWRAEYGRWLTGADVVILPDNDPQSVLNGKPQWHSDGRPKLAGQDHAADIAKSLRGIAARVRVLELPDLPPKGDVTDWIGAGGTIEQLAALANVAPDGEAWLRGRLPHGPMPPIEAPQGNKFGRLRVLSVEDALNAPPRTYLLEGLLAPGELSVFWGKPKCGKSFLMMRLAYGQSQGMGMWDREAVQVPVLYVAAEGEGGVKGRIRALHDAMGPAPNFHLIAQSVDLFDPSADLSDLIGAAKALGVRLLVLDTLARVMGAGDENATRDMNAFVRNCDRIREETKAHVAIVHHGGWDGSHARGSIALMGAADLVVKVDGEQGCPRTARVEYAKDDEGGDALGFTLEVRDLPPDAKGKPRTTCLAVASATPLDTGETKGKGLRTNEEAATLLREIQDAFATGQGRIARPKPGMPDVLTMDRKILQAALIQAGWLRLSSGLSIESQQMESLPEREQTRLWKRLNHLKLQGKIGFTRRDVWLIKTELGA